MTDDEKLAEVLKLLATKRDIEESLRLHEEDLKLLRASRVVGVQDLLKESLQIQYNCHAPNGYTIGMPLFKSHPPAPQPEEMRVGALSSYNKSVGKFGRDEGMGSATPSNAINAIVLLTNLRENMALKRNRQLAEQSSSHGAVELLNEGEDTVDDNEHSAEVDNIALKKARTVNISFGMSDSEDSDGD